MSEIIRAHVVDARHIRFGVADCNSVRPSACLGSNPRASTRSNCLIMLNSSCRRGEIGNRNGLKIRTTEGSTPSAGTTIKFHLTLDALPSTLDSMDKASWEREAMRVWGIALEIRLRGADSKKAIN